MSLLRSSQAQSILTRVAFIRVEITDIEGCRNITYITYQTDRVARRNIEHAIENTINAVIDIAKILLANNESGIPETYRDILLKTAEVGLIPAEEAAALAETVSLRNRLAHRYLDQKWPAIRNFLDQHIDVVKNFIERTESLALASSGEFA